MKQRELWPEVRDYFAGVDLILHAGDIVHPMVLDWLEEIAPVIAARGNNDRGIEDRRIEDLQVIDVMGRRLAMLHDTEPEHRPIDFLRRYYLGNQPADIIVTGHTHLERIDFREGVLQLNPGSATLPHHRSFRMGTLALLDVTSEGLEARILRIGESEGLPNPGVEQAFSLRNR